MQMKRQKALLILMRSAFYWNLQYCHWHFAVRLATLGANKDKFVFGDEVDGSRRTNTI